MNAATWGLLARLELRHMLGQRRIWFVAFFLALPVVLTYLIVRTGVRYEEPVRAALHFYLFYPQTVCILAAALYGSSLIQAEIQGKTITYLLTRPVPRWMLLLGKYAGVVAALSAMTIASFLASLALSCPGAGLAFASTFSLSIALSIAAYCAIFALLGLLFPRNALAMSLAYGTVVEFAFSLMPAIINKITVAFYVRSLLVRGLGLEFPSDLGQLTEVVGDLGLPVSAGALVLICCVALAFCVLLLNRREDDTAEKT